MIKVIAFDNDGVISDLKETHYIALNKALFELNFPIITVSDHLKTFDGLPTKKKMEMLGLLPAQIEEVNELKQIKTQELIEKVVIPNQEITNVLEYLKFKQLPICLVSNSVFATCVKVLEQMKIIDYFSTIVSNEHVFAPKPNPAPYQKVIDLFGCEPSEVLVVEDNIKGILAAERAGCNIFVVKNSKDVTVENIKRELKKYGS